MEKTPNTVAATIPKIWRRKYRSTWYLMGVLLSDRALLIDRSSSRIAASLPIKTSYFIILVGINGVEVFVKPNTVLSGLIGVVELVV
jgi:hypothetical protein